jgi:hypothetical protein
LLAVSAFQRFDPLVEEEDLRDGEIAGLRVAAEEFDEFLRGPPPVAVPLGDEVVREGLSESGPTRGVFG